MSRAIDPLDDHPRPADTKVVAFTAHVFDQNGEVQFTTPGDHDNLGIGGDFDAQCDVVDELALETLDDVAAGDETAFTARER